MRNCKLKHNLNETIDEINTLTSEIKTDKFQKKNYLKWAIIPPIVVFITSILALAIFSKIITPDQGIHLFDRILHTALIGPNIVSLFYPIVYGPLAWKKAQEIKEKENTLENLELSKTLQEDNLKIVNELSTTYTEDMTRNDKIRELFLQRKEIIMTLYQNGNLSECYKIGLTGDEISYLESLILESLSQKPTELTKEPTRTRIKPQNNRKI